MIRRLITLAENLGLDDQRRDSGRTKFVYSTARMYYIIAS